MPEKSSPCNLYPECSDCQNEISCYKKIAGVLSDIEVKQLELMPNAKQENYNPTICDLSLGSFHYVYGMPKLSENISTKRHNKEIAEHEQISKKWVAVCIGSDTEMKDANTGFTYDEQFVRQNKTKSNVLTIPALGSALIQLNEIVDTYSVAINNNVLVTGRFDLKLTLVNKGLISQQGTQIEPCYKGRLYCFVHNLSNKDISLNQGEPIASIEFSYVSCFCNEEKRKEVINNLIEKNKKERRYLETEYCDEGKGILNVRYFNRKKYLPDSCGLSHISEAAISAVKEQQVIGEITDVVKKRIDKRTTIITASITAIASIIVALIAGYFGFVKPLIEETKSLNDSVQKYEEVIKEYQNDLDEIEQQLNEIDSGVITNSSNADGGN